MDRHLYAMLRINPHGIERACGAKTCPYTTRMRGWTFWNLVGVRVVWKYLLHLYVDTAASDLILTQFMSVLDPR
jgi:hypothetical protein